MTRLIRVAAAVITRADGAVLLARRRPGKPYAGLWEFPGGKLEPGETPEQCLTRELHEELGLAVAVGAYVATGFDGPVELLGYRVSILSGTPRLTDHEEGGPRAAGRDPYCPDCPLRLCGAKP